MAVKRYLDKWYSENTVILKRNKRSLTSRSMRTAGDQSGVGVISSQHVHGGTSYDKMGVLQESC